MYITKEDTQSIFMPNLKKIKSLQREY